MLLRSKICMLKNYKNMALFLQLFFKFGVISKLKNHEKYKQLDTSKFENLDKMNEEAVGLSTGVIGTI